MYTISMDKKAKREIPLNKKRFLALAKKVREAVARENSEQQFAK